MMGSISLSRALVFASATLICFQLIIVIGTQAQQQQQTPLSARTSRPNSSPLTPKLKSDLAANNNQKLRNELSASSSGSSLRARSIGSTSSSGSSANIKNSTQPSGRVADFVEDELPPDFYEMPAERLDLGMNATGRAPTPILNVAVLQNGQVIDNEITVHPGTPLEMVMYLDDKSAKVYGLLASYLKVQDDTYRQREEVLISNGCSIDSYIFGNFEHNPEDQSLRAKFRAFKFPESNFVRFIGTVNVCIKQCPRVNCNGGGGNRRKRRAASINGNDNGRLVQLTVSTVLRIGYDKNH